MTEGVLQKTQLPQQLLICRIQAAGAAETEVEAAIVEAMGAVVEAAVEVMEVEEEVVDHVKHISASMKSKHYTSSKSIYCKEYH